MPGPEPIVRDLIAYLRRVNDLNDFDLTWSWFGRGDTPLIEVYENEEHHTLAVAPVGEIIEKVRESLNHWHLVDPDA